MKFDSEFCVHITVIQEPLWTKAKLIPGKLCGQNLCFNGNPVYSMFIPTHRNSKNASLVTAILIKHENWDSTIITSFTHFQVNTSMFDHPFRLD